MSQTAGSLDTNVILRMLLNDIPEQHTAALKLLHDASGPFWVSDVAIVEVVFVLSRAYGYTRPQVAEVVGRFVNLPEYECNSEMLSRALQCYVSHRAMSFEDCYLSVSAEIRGSVPLWTFDKKLANQIADAALVGAES